MKTGIAHTFYIGEDISYENYGGSCKKGSNQGYTTLEFLRTTSVVQHLDYNLLLKKL